MTDFELLRGYALTGSQDDFATLVGRYTNLVFSAALRHTSNPRDAEEISQAVFMLLSRKAALLDKNTILAGWLLRATRLVALNAPRKEPHRRRVENDATTELLNETDSAWQEIAPVLDEALLCLADRDRDAVVLRFFEQKSFKEIARIIGASDDNAQKRVARALAKLRAVCVQRGVVATATILATAITTHSVGAAPAHLAGSITGAALSGTGAAGTASTLADQTLVAIETGRVKTNFLKIAALALILANVWLAMHIFWAAKSSAPSAGTSAPKAPIQTNSIPSHQP